MISPLLARKLSRNGIVYPYRTIREAKRAGLALSLACALLDQESGGGHNVFGHDPTIFVGAGQVTKAKYEAYKRLRGHTLMQGVGPCQLTWYGYQDQADALGGCWQPAINMRVGFRLLASHIAADGRSAGIAAYNGTGPAAQRYSASVEARADRWHKFLTGQTKTL